MLRFLTRLIPWWLWLLAALALSMPALIAVTKWMAGQEGLAAAMRQAEPQVQPLESFDPPADPGPFDAVRIGGQWSPALDVPEDPTALESWLALEHFTVMVAPDGTWLGLWAPVWRADAMRSALAAGAKANGMIAVSGFVMDAAATRRFAAALERRGLRVPPRVAVIAPYFGPQAQAISAREAELRGFAIGWGVAAALALVIAISRYRGWRGRVRERRQARAGEVPAGDARAGDAQASEARASEARAGEARAGNGRAGGGRAGGALAEGAGASDAPVGGWTAQMAKAMRQAEPDRGQGQTGAAKPATKAAPSEKSPPPIKSRDGAAASPITTLTKPPPIPGKGVNTDPVIRSARKGTEFDKSPIVSSGRSLFS